MSLKKTTGTRSEQTAATTQKHRTGEIAEDRRTAFALLVAGGAGAYVLPLPDEKTFVVGRTTDCNLVIDDASISRAHARLVLDATLTIEDLGSTNGTKVQGRRLQVGERAILSVGTVFELGSVTLVLQRVRGAHKPTGSHPPRLSNRPASPSSPATPALDAPVLVEPLMRNLYAMLDVIAPSPLNVLVLGETGVGKELYAAAVHERSTRARQPFLRINCAALPEAIAEAELFGYERGAFTSAVQAKPGLFESADGGTVFLDEVGELPPAMQAKLLRVLENGETMRLGALRPKQVDVRFVAATNRDPRRAIADGTLREDLYFRLNGISITLPPLRRRPADIAPLARRFAEKLCATLGRPAIVMSTRVITALEGHRWPGNVRELKNVIERAVVLCTTDELDLHQLAVAEPEAFSSGGDTAPVSEDSTPPKALRDELKALEKQRIVDVLAKAGGNQSQAAKMLGMSRYTLMTRIEQYGLSRPRKGQ